MDNAQLQNVLAIGLLYLIFIGAALAGAYIWVLTRFFNELREKDHAVWQRIGSPTLANMFFMPMVNFRKFYAFLPILRERRNSGYSYAGRAYFMLILGLLYLIVILASVAALAVSES